MNVIWDAKNNFILLHFITLHQEQSLTSDINWLAIVNDIHLEIFSTPMVKDYSVALIFEKISFF